ncbi:uncharacterized protein LOC131953326 [Physella acuta]|uniref:uncharacterized protein LOC131953326 n=1 Tax=Physella acuta TaxID=109671 RepID=UPI0027DD81D1|nr:uncharacterized protein LOC131953326 [Physella acuta]
MMLLALPLVATLEVIGNLATLAKGRNTKHNTLIIPTAKLDRKKAQVPARKVSSTSDAKVGGRCAGARSMNKSRNRRDKSGRETNKCCCGQSELEPVLQLTSSPGGDSFCHPDNSSLVPQLCAAELTLNSQKVTSKSPSTKPSSNSFLVCTRCGQESDCTDNNIQHLALRHYSPLEQNDKDGDVCLTRSIDKHNMASAESQTTPTSHSIYNTRIILDENLFVLGSRTLINDTTQEVSDVENIDFLSEVVEQTTILPEPPIQPKEVELGNSQLNQPSGGIDQLGLGTTLEEVGGKEDKTNIVSQKSKINVNNSHSGSESGTVSQQDEENIPRSKQGSARPSLVNTKQRSSEQRSSLPNAVNGNQIPSRRSSEQRPTQNQENNEPRDERIDDQYAIDARQEDKERMNTARSRQGSARLSDVNINPIPSKRSSEQKSTQPSEVNINQIPSKRSSEQRSTQPSGVNINQIPSKRSSEHRSTQPSGVNINQIPSKRSSEHRSTQSSGVNINQIPSKRSSEQRSTQPSGVNINQIPSKRSSEQRSTQPSGVNINQIPSKRSSEQRSTQPSGVNINQIPSKRSSEQRSTQPSGVNINQIPSKRSSGQRSAQSSGVNINQFPSKRSSEQRSTQPSTHSIVQAPLRKTSEQRSIHSSGVNISQASNRSLSERRSTQQGAPNGNDAPSRRSSFVTNHDNSEPWDERIDAHYDDERNNILPSQRGSVQQSAVEDSLKYSKRLSFVEDATVNQAPSKRASEQRSTQPSGVNINQIPSKRSSEQRSTQPSGVNINQIPSKRSSEQRSTQPSGVNINQIPSKRSSEQRSTQPSADSIVQASVRKTSEQRSIHSSGVNISQASNRSLSERRPTQQGAPNGNDVSSRRSSFVTNHDNSEPWDERIDAHYDDERNNILPSQRGSVQQSAVEDSLKNSKRLSFVEDVTVNKVPSKKSSEQRSTQPSGVTINQIPSKRSSEQRFTQSSWHIINQAPSKRSSEQKSRPPSLNTINRIPSRRSSFVTYHDNSEPRDEGIDAHYDDERNNILPSQRGSVQQNAVEDSLMYSKILSFLENVTVNQAPSKRASEQRSTQPSGVNINQITSKRSSEQRFTQSSWHIINQAPSKRSSEQKSRPPSLNTINRIPSKRSSFVADQEIDYHQEEIIEAQYDDFGMNEMKPTSKVQLDAYENAEEDHQIESRFDNEFQIQTNRPDTQPIREINQREANSDTHLDGDPRYRPNSQVYREKQKTPLFACDTVKEVCVVGATSRSCDPCEAKTIFTLLSQGMIKCEKRHEIVRAHRGTCSDDESQSVCRKKCLVVCPEPCRMSSHRTQRPQDYEDSRSRSKSSKHYDDRSGSQEKKSCTSSGCDKRGQGCVLGQPGRICIGTCKRQCVCPPTREEHENLQSPSRLYKSFVNMEGRERFQTEMAPSRKGSASQERPATETSATCRSKDNECCRTVIFCRCNDGFRDPDAGCYLGKIKHIQSSGSKSCYGLEEIAFPNRNKSNNVSQKSKINVNNSHSGSESGTVSQQDEENIPRSKQGSARPSLVNTKQRSSEQRSSLPNAVNGNQIPSRRSSEQRPTQNQENNDPRDERIDDQHAIDARQEDEERMNTARSRQGSARLSDVNINPIPSKRSSEQRSTQPSGANINQIPSKRSSEQRSTQPSGVNINQIPSKRSSEQRSTQPSEVNINQIPSKRSSEQRSTQPSVVNISQIPSKRSSEQRSTQPSTHSIVQAPLRKTSEQRSIHSSGVNISQASNRSLSERRPTQQGAPNGNDAPSRRSSFVTNHDNSEPRDERIDAHYDDERNNILPSQRGSVQQSAVNDSPTYSKRSSFVGNVTVNQAPSKRASEQRSTQPSGVNINQIPSKRSSEQRSTQPSGVNINQIPSKRSSEQRSTRPSGVNINQIPSKRSSEQKSRPPSLNTINQIPSKRSSFVADQEIDYHQEEIIEHQYDDFGVNEMKPTSKVQLDAYENAEADHQIESRFDNEFQIQTNRPDTQPIREINQREANSDTHLDGDPRYRPNSQVYREKQKTPLFACDTVKEVCVVGATSRSCDPCEAKTIFTLLSQGMIKCEKRHEIVKAHRGTCSDDESQSVCRKKCLVVCPEPCRMSSHRTQRPQDYEDSRSRSKSAKHYDDRSGSQEKKSCTSSGCDKRGQGCVLGQPGRICIGTFKRQCVCPPTREEHENLQSPSRLYKRKQENLNDKHNIDYDEDVIENVVYPVGSARTADDKNHIIKPSNYDNNDNDPVGKEVNFQELKERAPRSPPRNESFVNMEGRERLQTEMAPSRKRTASQERPATETSATCRSKDNECCRAVIFCRCNDGFHDPDAGCYLGKIKHIQSFGSKSCNGIEERAFPNRAQTSYAESDECEYFMTLNSDLTGSGAEEFRDVIEESYKDCATDLSADARKNFKDCVDYSSAKQYAASGSQPRRPSTKEGTQTCYLAPLCRDVRDFMCDTGQDFTVQLNDASDEDCEQRAMDLKSRIYRKITVDPREIIEFRKLCHVPLEGVENADVVVCGKSEPREYSRRKTDPELEERVYDTNERKESYNSPFDERVNNDIENNVDDTDISKETEASSDFNNEYNEQQEVAQIDETSRIGTPELEPHKDEAASAPMTGSSRPMNQDETDDITEIRDQDDMDYDVNDDSQSINDSIVREDDMSEPVVTESIVRTETVSNRTSSQIPDIEYEKAKIAEKVKSVSSVQKTTTNSAVQSPSPSKVTSTKDSFTETVNSKVQSQIPSKVTSTDKATSLENTSFTETANSTVQSQIPSKVTSMEKATSQERASFIEKVNSAVQSPTPSKVTSMEKVTSQERASFIEKVNSAVQSPTPSKVTSMEKATSQDKALFAEEAYSAARTPSQSKPRTTENSAAQTPSPSKVTSMEKATSQERASFIEKVNSAVQSPIPSKVTSMEKATSQERASFIEKVNSAVQSPTPSKVTSMEKATSQDKALFAEEAYSAARTPSQSKPRTTENSAAQTPSPSKASMENASKINAVSPTKVLSAKQVRMLCRDENPELYYTEMGQTFYSLLSRVNPRNVTEDESAESLAHVIDFMNDLIQSDLCLKKENYDETSEVGGGSAKFKLNNLSRRVSNGDIIDTFKALIESYYNSIGDICTIVRENNKVIRFDEDGSTEFDFYALLENKGVTEQPLPANVVSRYDVACDVDEDFRQLLDEMDVQRKSIYEVGSGNVRIDSRRTSKRDFASSVLKDFEEEIMQRVLTTACQTEQTYSEANEETEQNTQDQISVSSKHGSSMSRNRISRTNSREVGNKSSTDRQRAQSLLNEDLYDQDGRESQSNVAKTKSDSVTGDDVESQYIGEMEKYMDEDSAPDEMAQLSKPNLKKSSKNGTRTSKEDKDRIVSAVGGKPTGSRIDEEDEGDVKVDSPSQLSPDTDSEKAVSSADSDRSPSRKSRKKAGTSDEEEATESAKGPRLKKKKKKKTKKASRIKKDRKRHESEADVDSTGNDEDSANETTAVGENKHALSSLDSDSEPDKRSKKPVASEDEEDAEDSEKKAKHDKKSQKLRKSQKKPKIKKEKKPTKNEGGDGKMNRRSKKAQESDEVSDSELPTSESVSKVSGSASKVGRKKKTRAVAHSEDEDSEENSPSPPRSRKAKASSPDEESSEVESTPKRKSKSKHAVCESTCMCENSCIPKCCCRVVKFAHCDERACCSKRHTRTRSPESSSDEEEERSERKKRQKRNRQLTESSESDSEEERSRPRTQRNTSKKERRTRNSSSERDRGVMVPVVGSTSMYPYPTQAMGGFSHCTPVPAEAGTSSIFVYVNESDCEDPETLQRVLGEKIKKGTATQSQANPCQYMTCDPACYVADPAYYYNC